MPMTTCPACNHTFTSSEVDPIDTPDATVVNWFRQDEWTTSEVSTDDVYTSYLLSTDETPVSRQTFVANLAYLGVEEVLDDDTRFLVRR